MPQCRNTYKRWRYWCSKTCKGKTCLVILDSILYLPAWKFYQVSTLARSCVSLYVHTFRTHRVTSMLIHLYLCICVDACHIAHYVYCTYSRCWVSLSPPMSMAFLGCIIFRPLPVPGSKIITVDDSTHQIPTLDPLFHRAPWIL